MGKPLLECKTVLDFAAARDNEGGGVDNRNSVRRQITAKYITTQFLQAGCPSCCIIQRGVIYTSYYAALLPRRGPHIASHSVCLSACPSVRLSVRPSRYREPSVTSHHLANYNDTHVLFGRRRAAYRTAISAAQILVGAKDDGGGGNNWSYKTCKAPVKSSPPTNHHPSFYKQDVLPVTQPTVPEH